MSSFSDPRAVANYIEGLQRQVPGLHSLHQMVGVLLAEHVPPDGRVLVLGGGGGLELKSFAGSHPQWRLLGVDPSAPMLELATRTLGTLASKVELIEGYIDAAPAIEFDGAACLLTMHFLSVEQRLHTLRELRRRLRPGAPLVVAHHSVPPDRDGKMRWLQRYAAFISANGIPAENAASAIKAMASQLPLLSPEVEVDLLQQAGFVEPELFHVALTFRGWVAYVG